MKIGFISILMLISFIVKGVDNSKYHIFNNNQQFTDFAFKNAKATELSPGEFAEVKKIIPECVKQYNSTSREPLKNLRRYYMQLVPVLNAAGEKEVWINCFCENNDGSYWKSNIVSVLDGGNCYFNLKVNLTKKTYYDLAVNGVA